MHANPATAIAFRGVPKKNHRLFRDTHLDGTYVDADLCDVPPSLTFLRFILLNPFVIRVCLALGERNFSSKVSHSELKSFNETHGVSCILLVSRHYF